MNTHVYDRITERIIALLAQGTVPWHKPWKARTGLPRNFVTKKSYRGINVFLLLAMSFESPIWLTFRQALRLGGSVRKGEKACPVVFWKQTTIEDKASGEQRQKRLLRIYHVFNVTQCDGLENCSTPIETPVNGVCKPKEIVAHMPQRLLIKHGMARGEATRILDGDRWVSYTDSFQIRHWQQPQILSALERAGFALDADLSAQFAGSGSHYYLASRRACR